MGQALQKNRRERASQAPSSRASSLDKLSTSKALDTPSTAADRYHSCGSAGLRLAPHAPPVSWRACDDPDAPIRLYSAIEALKTAAAVELGSPWLRATLVDATQVWFMGPTGAVAPGGPLSNDFPFAEAIKNYRNDLDSPDVVVTDMSRHPVYRHHSSVQQRMHLRFFAVSPIISAFNGHCLGVISWADMASRAAPTPVEAARLRALAAAVAAELQADLVELMAADEAVRAAGEDEISGMSSGQGELPAVWFDPGTPSWDILRVNSLWNALTGASVEEMRAAGGLLDVLTPSNSSEAEALHAATRAAKPLAPHASLSAVMAPTDPSGAWVQLLLALRPAPEPGAAPDTPAARRWVAEVHARLCADLRGLETPTAVVDALRNSSNSTTDPPTLRPSLLDSLDGDGSGSARHHSTSNSSGGMNSSTGAARAAFSSMGSGIIGTPHATAPTLARSSASPMATPPISGLQIGALLGSGSFGSVYAGLLGDLPVAVKVVSSGRDDAGTARHLSASYEATLAIEMRHPNLIKTLAWTGRETDSFKQVWIVNELADRGSLSEAIEAGTMGPPPVAGGDLHPALETALDIARGLAHLHHRGVVHADLSSNNIMLVSATDAEGAGARGFVAKVTDFGMWRSADEMSTKTVGTVSHMAPEALADGVVGKAADVFGFGVILYELLAGERAWKGASVVQVIFQVTVKGRTLQVPEGAAPPPAVALAHACMAMDPADRPAFDEIVTALEGMLAAA